MVKKMCNGARVSLRIMQITRWTTVVSFGSLLLVLGTPFDAQAVPAFPGCEGFGCETKGGRLAGSSVCIVTNLNVSGSGSLNDCLLGTSPRFITFNVAGIIPLAEPEIMIQHSNFHVLGQTAPGDGVMLRSDFTLSGQRAFRIGECKGVDGAHDIVWQHVRFRLFAGSAASGSNKGGDAFLIACDSHHIVMDHVDVMWTSDENHNIWGTNIHDITLSHSIFGEPGRAQKYGPLINTFPGGFMWNLTYHHNLYIHHQARSQKVLVATNSSAASNRGMEYINNVHYNATNVNHHQTGTAKMTPGYVSRFDVIGQYTKDGPNNTSWPVNFLTHEPRDCATWPAVWQIYFTGSTWRDINDNPTANNDEANNYNMVRHLQTPSCPQNQVNRTGRIDQPEFPVTIQSFQDAYNTVVIDEDVGAQPQDAHSQRLVDDVELGRGYNENLIPPPFGSGSVSFTGTPRTDTDSDGIPDSYEVTIGTDPNVFENQAVLDSDGDGYVNIEDWAHSLVGITTIPPSKPNPPTIVNAN